MLYVVDFCLCVLNCVCIHRNVCLPHTLCSVLSTLCELLAPWSVINHNARFYRLSVYLFLFNRFKDQELASDIKQLLLDGRNTAVAMAIVLSPLLFPGNLSLLCFFFNFPFSSVPFLVCFSFSSSFFLLSVRSLCSHYMRHSPPHACTPTHVHKHMLNIYRPLRP